MLNISIVLYHPRWEEEVVPLVEELLRCRSLRKIYLIDNRRAERPGDTSPWVFGLAHCIRTLNPQTGLSLGLWWSEQPSWAGNVLPPCGQFLELQPGTQG